MYIIDDEIQQSTALRWISEFLNIAQEVMVPFTPRLISAMLPNLAHHVPMIQSAAMRTNKLLLRMIQSLPPPPDASPRQSTDKSSSAVSHVGPGSPTPTTGSLGQSRQSVSQKEAAVPSRDMSSPESPPDPPTTAAVSSIPKSRPSTLQPEAPRALTSTENVTTQAQTVSSRPGTPTSGTSGQPLQQSPEASLLQEKADQIDYQATVNALTIQFLSEHEETRVAALKWLIMLHSKAPKKVNFLLFISLDIELILV